MLPNCLIKGQQLEKSDSGVGLASSQKGLHHAAKNVGYRKLTRSFTAYLRIVENKTCRGVDGDRAGVRDFVRRMTAVELNGIKLRFSVFLQSDAPIRGII
jgi:hypothetical protein